MDAVSHKTNVSLKTFAGANAALLCLAVASHAWGQDPGADARDRAVSLCMAEAKARGAKMGATDVAMAQVEDTDEKSDGRASVRARVDVVMRQKDGTLKTVKKTFKCDTRHEVVTAFKYY
ncbi:hypothetical protein I5E68_17975 [Novosphingobium sp. YJ-S2-02]|uniref:UrcA family protein n=1 Tax=Novosphingobium aureum TaxID=2792964 RepID=A0A931HEU7_9SPHN|nr:hypothetical protein [Novosphingobium aureum]MBH0114840.1 hypothetical protein [Novosphingobium aureum]